MTNPNNDYLFSSNGFTYPCDQCGQKRPKKKFPQLSNGVRGKVCTVCKPLVVSADVLSYLNTKRAEDLCKVCNKASLIYWYRSDGKLCDVFAFANQGYSVNYLKRFISQLTPKCEPCADAYVLKPSQQALNRAEAMKGKAASEKDPKKKKELWRLYFRALKRVAVLELAETTGEEVEIEIQPGWSADWFGGTDEI